jgi:hypothetical protein
LGSQRLSDFPADELTISALAGFDMSNPIKRFASRGRWPLAAMMLMICVTSARAEDAQSESINQDNIDADSAEMGIGIGALVFLGPDFRLYYRKAGSPWLFGLRYLDIEDDFINKSAVGLPGDESDREYTTRVGVYVDYLFSDEPRTGSFYASGALYKTTRTIECYSVSDSDSATGLYIGGGYRGSFGDHVGYNIGLLLSPFVNLELETPYCSQTNDGDFDLNVSLTIKF